MSRPFVQPLGTVNVNGRSNCAVRCSPAVSGPAQPVVSSSQSNATLAEGPTEGDIVALGVDATDVGATEGGAEGAPEDGCPPAEPQPDVIRTTRIPTPSVIGRGISASLVPASSGSHLTDA